MYMKLSQEMVYPSNSVDKGSHQEFYSEDQQQYTD